MAPSFALQSTLTKLRGQAVAAYAATTRDGGPADAHAIYQQMLARRRLEATTEEQATAKANEVGQSVRKAIKQLRGGTEKFYNDLITAVQIKLCESDDTKKTRYVSSTDDRAYLYDDGSCIKLVNAVDSETTQAYAQGLCEVKPNCYWDDFDPQTDTDRYTKYAESETMTADDADAKIKSYAQSVGMFAAPGIILAVLSLLTMFFFLLCRCCCNKCGGRKPREGGYSCVEKFLPVLFFFLFGVGIAACAGSAFLFRTTAVDGVSDTFGGISHTIGNASEWTYEIGTPLESIRDTVVDSTTSISTTLSGMDNIGTDMETLVGMLNAIGSDVSGLKLPADCTSADAVCIECTTCSTIGTEVTNAATQIDDNAGPAVADLDNVHEELNSLLVDVSDDVKNAVKTTVDMLESVRTTLDDTQGQIDDVQKYFDDYKKYIGYAILAIFAVGLVVVAVGLVGVLFGLTPIKILANIMHIAYFLGFIALFVTFLISAIMLAVSVLMGDMCEVVDILSQNWTVPLGDDTGKIVDACFQNQSLIDVLDLSDKFEFARGGIDFPDIDLSSATNFDALDVLNSTIQDTTAEGVFPVEASLNEAIDDLNALTKQTNSGCTPTDGNYKAEDILEPWVDNGGTDPGMTGLAYMIGRYDDFDTPCDADLDINNEQYTCHASTCTYSVAVGEVYSNASGLYTVQVDSSTFVTGLQTDVAAVMTFSDTFSTKLTTMTDAISAIKDNLEASLIKDVDEFEAAMYCTFISDGYDEIFAALCGDVMPSLTMLSLLLYLVGFFLIPVNVCLIIGVKRLKARGNGGHVMDNEMKFK
jgi:hypothetical protein